MSTATEPKPHVAVLKDLSKRCIERADALGVKGQKRNEMAMNYFCGAGIALSITGQHELANAVSFWTTAILAPRGFKAVEDEAL